MISIQSAMLVALGFLMASLLALLLASAFWSRAVRLTTKRLTSTLPVSEPEIKADLDRLRAAYAIKVHKLETQLEQAKLERARHLIEINRRDASISALENDVVTIKAELEENLNARRVLEQTLADRLPRVEARLAEAKQLLANRDREIAELAQGARRHKAALEEASAINAQRAAEIERLNSALATRGGRRRRTVGEPEPEGEVALRAEVEALRAKTREQAALIDRLQRQLGERHAVMTAARSVPATAPAPEASDGQVDRLRESLSEAERTLQLARSGTPADAPRDDREVELRALKAKTEDQAGEIARLKAALAAFEQRDPTGVRNSRLALIARAGSAEAQAERQAATISRLRAELAAANERLAQQAAHYMEEMRRIGASTAAVATQTRRGGRDGRRRRLAERAAQVPPSPGPAPEQPAALELAGAAQAGATRRATVGNGRGPEDERGVASSQVPATAQPSAAEMPQTAAIPAEPRRTSLLDRITGIGKN